MFPVSVSTAEARNIHLGVLADLSAIAQINPPLDRCVVSDAVQVNFIPMKAVEPEGGGLTHPETCTYGEVKKGYTPFLSGDVIMAKITPCMENGKTAVVPDLPDSVCFGSTEFHVFRPEQDINPHWLSYYLVQSNFRKLARMHMAGSAGQLRVPAPFLHTIKIPLAPLAEQQRIIEKVDELLIDIDAGVTVLERVQKKLVHYRASVLKAAAEGTLTAEWRQQNPSVESASELLARMLVERRRRWEEEQLRRFSYVGKEPPKNWRAKYKEPATPNVLKLPTLPEGWCWASAEALFYSIRSGSTAVPQNEKTNYPILRSSSVRPMKINLNDIRYLPEKNSKAEINYLREHDLLFTRLSGSLEYVGNCVAIPELHDLRIQYPDRLFCAKLVDPEQAAYISMYFSSAFARRSIEAMAKSTAGHQRISLGGITEQPVALPPLQEQHRIATEVEDQLSVIEHIGLDIEAKLKTAQGLRQSILRDAFSGKLVPQDRNNEPASELLKRISAEREERQQQAIYAKRPPVKKKQSRKRAAAI